MPKRSRSVVGTRPDVSSISKREPGFFLQRQRPDGHLDFIVAPVPVAGHEQRRKPQVVIDQVLFQVRLGPLVSGGPQIVMHDRIAPGEGPHAAVLDVVVLLDRAVQLTDRGGEQAGRESGEVVGEEVDGLLDDGWSGGRDDARHDEAGERSHRVHGAILRVSACSDLIHDSLTRLPGVAHQRQHRRHRDQRQHAGADHDRRERVAVADPAGQVDGGDRAECRRRCRPCRSPTATDPVG